MNRLSLFLLVCTGLVFVGSGIQSSRADRLRAQAHALQPTGASLGSVEADLAGVRATVARMRLQSVDAAARPEVLSELADALAREVRRAGAHLTRLSIEPDGPALTLSATGDRLAIARLVSRVDTLLESHEAYAERFSLGGGYDRSASLDLSITHRPDRGGPSIDDRRWPAVGPGAVADALERAHESIERADAAANASDNAKPIATAPIDPAATTIVRWLGTIRAGGSERYVLRFEDEGVVATLGEREAAVLGWAVLARDGDRLHVSREGRLYEVHR